jgi:UbiD family decarboxylase
LIVPAAADREPHPRNPPSSRACASSSRRIEKVAIPTSVGVGFRIVMAMKQHFAGKARAALLAAMATNLRPRIVVVVDPDIDVPGNAIGPVQVA